MKYFLFALLALAVSTAAYFFYQNQNPKPRLSSSEPSPAPLLSPSPMPLIFDWKSHNSPGLHFSYPPNLTLKENAQNYFVLLTDPANPQSVFASIDARKSGAYSSFEVAKSAVSDNLSILTSETLPNGIKISGKISEGYGNSQKVTMVLFDAHPGAVAIETTVEKPEDLNTFGLILSTFRVSQ